MPVVASAVAGLAESLPGAARFVQPGSSAALAEGISEVLGDAALRESLVTTGRALVGERFGRGRDDRGLPAVYEEVTPIVIVTTRTSPTSG